MRIWNFVFIFISVGFSFAAGQNDSAESENPTNTPAESMPNDNQKAPEKANQSTRQRKPQHPTTQDPNPVVGPRAFYTQFLDEGSAIPQLGFPGRGSQRQNIYLSDHTGQYDVQLQSFHRGNPTNFQAALGAISAHILNQRNNPEYIPYPPNGNPYNYPAYRGHPRATEPPVVRAYERASNVNYDAQPADFAQENPRGIFAPTNYQTDFPNQFQNLRFYDNSEFFNDAAFHSELRRSSDPVFDSRWYNQAERYQRPIK